MSISGSCWNLATKVALRLGPRNPLVYAMLARRCQAHGAKFGVREGVVEVVKGNRVVRLAADHFAFAPDIAKSFDSYHGAVVPERQNDCLVIDYSRPRPQRYARSGLVFEMCGVPEEEAAIEDYFRWYCPAPGEIVFDVGANCGVSAYHLSRRVGPTGRVYAFEPDPLTHDLLLKNLAAHGLDNVVPLRLALAGTSGTAAFQAEGTLGSTLARVASRDTLGTVTTVETIGLAEACGRFGTPAFIKLDIEGAEIEVLEASRSFLREHPIQLAIDTNHWVRGKLTAPAVEAILKACGYETLSSDACGFMTTWARKAGVSVPAG